MVTVYRKQQVDEVELGEDGWPEAMLDSLTEANEHGTRTMLSP